MFLARYSAQRSSALTVVKRSVSSTILRKLEYHTTRVATLAPLGSADSSSKSGRGSEEPIDDVGVPNVLMTAVQGRNKHHKDLELPVLPKIPASIGKDAFPIIEKKLEMCCTLCCFLDPEADKMAKGIKLATLRELMNVFASPIAVKVLPERLIGKFLEMIMANLMRDRPDIPRKFLFGNEEPQMTDIAWPHLSVVYHLLNGFHELVPDDAHFTDKKLLVKLISLLTAPSLVEREELAKFLVMHIAHFPDCEEEVLQRLSFLMIEYVEGRADPFCVTPALNIILERFKVAEGMKPMMKMMLNRILIRLVASPHSTSYCMLLVQVFDAILAFDADLLVPIISKVVNCWPETRPSKQVMFIGVFNSLVERLTPEMFAVICQTVFQVYAKCAVSCHVKVVDLSFQIWQNVKIMPLIIDKTRVIFPIMYAPLSKTMKEHWSQKGQNAALNAMRSMHEIDPFIFDEVAQAYKKGQAANIPNPVSAMLQKNWALVARSAGRAGREFNLAHILADIQMNFSTTCEKDHVGRGPMHRSLASMPSSPPPQIARVRS